MPALNDATKVCGTFRTIERQPKHLSSGFVGAKDAVQFRIMRK